MDFHMSRAENQLRTFDSLWTEIHPHVRADRNLPARIQQRLAKEKRFGSRDRRLYRELIYTALRYLPWLENETQQPSAAFLPQTALRIAYLALWLSHDTPATLPLKQALSASLPPCPATIAERAAALGQLSAALLPEWFREHCPAAFEPPNIDTLHTRAPLWLRLQTANPQLVFDEFAARGWTWRATPALPSAIELIAANDPDLTQTDAHGRGLIEIQDLGSQLILPTALAPVANFKSEIATCLDACAGAGGKTLQLAQLLAPSARIDATDPRAAALAELKTRAARAGLQNIRVRNADFGFRNAELQTSQTTSSPTPPKSAHSVFRNPHSTFHYDAVVVDAPCSGTGTWRRSPHLKYTTTAHSIRAAAALQLEILSRHAPLARPGGGLLIYATCSLSRFENEEVVTAFLAANRDFELLRQTTILPAEHDTDGFFTATLRRALS